MIRIQKSKTADTRSCDFSKVTKDVLLKSSSQHIGDVKKGIEFIISKLKKVIDKHDYDKITDIDGFHSDFIGGFENKTWWNKHKKISRHHLLEADGIRNDVNLIDVIEMIVDCVMAGMGRTGKVYPLEISIHVLRKAFDNTSELLQRNVIVEEAPVEEKQKQQPTAEGQN